MRQNMKRLFVFLFAIILLLCSCTTEMPNNSNNEQWDVIDEELFTLSESLLCNPYNRVFRNMPGMVLYSDPCQLYYINKTTGEKHLFCFDPLCDHVDESCVVNSNSYALYYLWSPADGCLYASQFDMNTGGNDGNFYRINTNTQEQELVIQGNGNEFRYMYANEDYFYFTRALKDGGFEILRYDPIKEKTLTMSPPDGRLFCDLFVSGDTILASFMDDSQLYLTDADFTSYTKTELDSMMLTYMDGTTVYAAVDSDGKSTGYLNTARELFRYDLLTQTKETILSVEDVALATIGFDGKYIYYRLNPLKEGSDSQAAEYGDILYRISVDGGEGEPLINFSMEHTGLDYELYAYMVCCYDGVIYCNIRSETRGISVDEVGTITQDEDGVWVFQTIE